MISRTFKRRVLSAVFLLPVVLYAIIAGGWAFKIFVLVGLAISVKEWVRMALKRRHVVFESALGILYLLFCAAAFYKLRMDFPQGLFFTATLLFGVWASDICAYFTGKWLGGPKLAPKISPNKTWAGFIGGTLGSALMVLALDYYIPLYSGKYGLEILPFAPLALAFVIGGFFTVFGQIGDLGMSYYKRKVGVKDTGTLIPGHGGILDRIDSLLLVTPFFLITIMVLLP